MTDINHKFITTFIYLIMLIHLYELKLNSNLFPLIPSQIQPCLYEDSQNVLIHHNYCDTLLIFFFFLAINTIL